jgi:hypothetical protein
VAASRRTRSAPDRSCSTTDNVATAELPAIQQNVSLKVTQTPNLGWNDEQDRRRQSFGAGLDADRPCEHGLVRGDGCRLHAVRPEDAKKLVALSGFANPTVRLLTGNTYNWLDGAGGKNYSGYSNPRLDYQVNYRVARQIILRDRPIIVLFHAIRFGAFSTSLTGVRLAFVTGNVDVAGAQFK